MIYAVMVKNTENKEDRRAALLMALQKLNVDLNEVDEENDKFLSQEGDMLVSIQVIS